MKNLKHTLFHHQPAFLIFLILLFTLVGSSACGLLPDTLSPLQIVLLSTLALLVAAGLLWLVLTAKLNAERSAYQHAYQLQLKESLAFNLKQNGTLTDRNGNPIPPFPATRNHENGRKKEPRSPDFPAQAD